MALITRIVTTLRLGTTSAQSSLLNCSRPISSFKYEDLQITRTTNGLPKPDNDTLKFGHNMTDHMLEIDWSEDSGWSAPVIRPLEPFALHPAAKVLHYSTTLFEGMKAYRCVDKNIRMFRPMENMKRMDSSTKRSALPEFDMDELLKCIKKLVDVDQEWVPYSDSCALYIRPTFIGTDPTLGVTVATEAKLYTILCPVGPYFPTGLKPVSLLADPKYVRAWPGGCGNYKMGSNYAPTIKVQQLALKEQGCQQVLWLYGEDHQLTEVGTMNLFFFWENEQGELELVTPPLDSGLILPGVTRKSMLEMARQWGEFKVTEASFNMPTLLKALADGRMKEVFGAGTACVVCPVERIVYKGKDVHIPVPDAKSSLCQRFYNAMTDIHYFRTPHHWMESIED